MTPSERYEHQDAVTTPSPTTKLDRAHPTEEVVKRHQRGVWRYLRFLGANPAVADDITQETFLVMLRSPPFDYGEAALAGWLRSTAWRLFRRANGTPRPGIVLADERGLEDAWQRLAADGQGDARMAALDACLQQLGRRERQLLEMRYRDGASREAMAAAIGVAPEGVKTLLRRVRDSLRECIERRMNDEA